MSEPFGVKRRLRFWVRIGRFRWPLSGRRTRFFTMTMLRRFAARERAREAFDHAIELRARDARQVEIDEFIDDELRHAHARDGIPCPICGAPVGDECIYGLGGDQAKWRGPGGQRYPGRVHTRRLMKFHAPTWPEVQWCEP